MRLFAAAAVASLVLAGTAGGAPGDTLYLALGDSVAVQNDEWAPGGGFVARYFAQLRAEGKATTSLNLAVRGHTTADLISAQLPAALSAIADASDTTVVTVSIGGNDLRRAECQPIGSPGCAFSANFRTILQQLRTALADDPGDEVVKVMEYYNAAAGGPDEQRTALGMLGLDGKVDCGGVGFLPGLNDVIHCVALEESAVPVDTYGPMLPGGQSLLADAMHPNDAGSAILADAFARATAPAAAPNPPAATTPRAAPKAKAKAKAKLAKCKKGQRSAPKRPCRR